MKSIAAFCGVLVCVGAMAISARQIEPFRLTGSIDHFDITCAPELDARAFEIGRAAERAYQRLASSLQHDLSLRPLLVVFATRAEFDQAVRTRTMPGRREHLAVTLDTQDERLDGDLVHDLSHVFLFDMLPAPLHREIPTWLMEGLAEHHRGVFDESDRTALQEMIRGAGVPGLGDPGAAPPNNRSQTIVGHAAFDFLVGRAGPAGPTRMITALRQQLERDPLDAFLATARLGRDDFDREFRAYLSKRAVHLAEGCKIWRRPT